MFVRWARHIRDRHAFCYEVLRTRQTILRVTYTDSTQRMSYHRPEADSRDSDLQQSLETRAQAVEAALTRSDQFSVMCDQEVVKSTYMTSHRDRVSAYVEAAVIDFLWVRTSSEIPLGRPSSSDENRRFFARCSRCKHRRGERPFIESAYDFPVMRSSC